MAGMLTGGTSNIPGWFVNGCQWLWKRRGCIWGTLILGVALNIFAALLITPWPWTTALKQTPVGLASQHLTILFSAGSILILLWVIVILGSRFPVAPSQRVIKRRYLQRMIRETELLRLTGIPAGLLAQSVPLDQIFIPIQFFPKRLPSDYPLTEAEYAHYRDLLQRGIFSDEMDRIFIGKEGQWLDILKAGQKISIANVWRQLSHNDPAAVIQGYPGMGKSTLLARLALHVARRGLREADPTMGEQLVEDHAAPVPILLLLKDYAIEFEKPGAADLSLIDYMKIAIERLHIEGLFPFLQRCLANGRCLVMLDGLDEVSDMQTRRRVKKAIETFIHDYHDASDAPNDRFNRFLITSRVAGYDVVAFGDYPHYTIAELTQEQINNFLPRWCRASIRRESVSATGEQEAAIAREAEEMARRLSEAMRTHQGVGKLAENPLLLTLLAVMQQNSIELPQQRAELYTIVTRTLLENRNIAKELQPIPEAQAIQRLGSIAFEMQESGNSFARRRDVETKLSEIIGQEGGTQQEIAQEVESFLERIRERSGLFVIRTGDYFGFFHRTFQEYFAARYLLNQIKRNPDTWIAELVSRARIAGDLWREPFLLAVAYQSGEDETIARRIIAALLHMPQDASFESQTHDALLAAECLIESKPATIGRELEKQIAEHLLHICTLALQDKKFDICEQIAHTLRSWLLSLPAEAYRPAVLVVLSGAMSDTKQPGLSHATLTLLTMLAQQLIDGPSIIFDMLVPPLLALAGLPAIGRFQPTPHLPASSDFSVIDLALCALSFMGKAGPGGALLEQVRQHFKEHPEHLRRLARYSLECGTLITPVPVPLTDDNYQSYEDAIRQWVQLRDHYRRERITERDVDTCLNIHTALLDCAEEASYSTSSHLLKLLQAADHQPGQNWQQVWQNYLLAQLTSGRYTDYQEIPLLWTALFPGTQATKPLADCILRHYNGNETFLQRNAQHFISYLSNELRELRELQDLSDLPDWLVSLGWLVSQFWQYWHTLRYLRYIRYLRYLRYLQDLLDLSSWRYLQGLQVERYLRYLRYLQGLQDLQAALLTHEVAEKAKRHLPATNPIQHVDLLTILLGRILHIQETGEMSDAVYDEVRGIVETALASTASTDIADVQQTALDILRTLPARSANEIVFVLQLAENTTDKNVQAACAHVLKQAAPVTFNAWTALEAGKRSKVEAVRKAVEKVFEGEKIDKL
jgi:hypothetical protein